jgi:RNA polymerase-binding transcription factor DksA
MEARHRKTAGSRARRKPRATTGDVLGSGPKPPQIKAKWRKHYQRLMELRDELARRQSRVAQDAIEEAPAFSSHMADAGTDTYDRDFALGVLSGVQEAAYEIEEALNRIRDGRYGICELTGKAIEPERLEAIPWTRFTAEAEKQLEREGKKVDEKAKKELFESVRATYEHQTDPRYAAARLWVDAIIDPAHTREALIQALEAAALNPEIPEFKTGVLQT